MRKSRFWNQASKIRDRVGFWVFAGSWLILSAGCSGRVSLEGTITLDGQPLDDATLMFLPQGMEEGPKKLRRCQAMSDKEGRFRVKTSDELGVFPGSYKVTVSKRKRPAGVAAPRTVNEAMAQLPTLIEVVPGAYRSEKTTPLVIEVSADGNKELTLDLSGKGQ